MIIVFIKIFIEKLVIINYVFIYIVYLILLLSFVVEWFGDSVVVVSVVVVVGGGGGGGSATSFGFLHASASVIFSKSFLTIQSSYGISLLSLSLTWN